MHLQIGVGLMICQQATGINGIGFYTAETFVAAGKWSEQSFYAVFKNKIHFHVYLFFQ